MRFNKQFVSNYAEIDINLEQFRLYLLFFGIIFFVTEIFLEIFSVRIKSELVENAVMSVAMLLLYYTTGKSDFVGRHVRLIFLICFMGYFSFVTYKLVFFPFEIITMTEFILVYFFSYSFFLRVMTSLMPSQIQ
ncbi:MAG: hypothetical protein EOP06_11220 [Proteobacteria bacterium]|nr:MAG: hypothetical protein EOP06_11220 [Pseudomonadota bacterium]